MAFVAVAKTSGIAPGTIKKVATGGVEILLANVGGTFYATAERCTHLGGHLAAGTIQDGIVTCPRHGAHFDLRTGKAVQGAKVLFLHMGVKDLPIYPVRIDGEDILVDVGSGQ